MTAPAIRIACAEECGWHSIRYGYGYPTKEATGVKKLPDFLNDLNDCAQFEATLKKKEAIMYYALLASTFNGEVDDIEGVRGIDKYDSCRWSNHALLKLGRATARQRCEAFLKVKGLWKPKQL